MKGLQDALQVEVSHVASETSKVLNLRAVLNQPGDYTADLIPTAPGVYEFRVFGAVEGNQIDETFVSTGGGGDFDDVQTAAALQFPNQVTGPREIESAVRGAIETSQQAKDAARPQRTTTPARFWVSLGSCSAPQGWPPGLPGCWWQPGSAAQRRTSAIAGSELGYLE